MEKTKLERLYEAREETKFPEVPASLPPWQREFYERWEKIFLEREKINLQIIDELLEGMAKFINDLAADVASPAGSGEKKTAFQEIGERLTALEEAVADLRQRI